MSKSRAFDPDLEPYMKKLKKFPLLRREDEKRLCRGIEEAEKNALRELLVFPPVAAGLARMARAFLEGRLDLKELVKSVNRSDEDGQRAAIEKICREMPNLCRDPEKLLKAASAIRPSCKKIAALAELLAEGLADQEKYAKIAEASSDPDARTEYGEKSARVLKKFNATHDAMQDGLARARSFLSEADRLRNELVRRNLRLVLFVAKKYAGSGTRFGDLVQEGNVGLTVAADKFDWRLENKFGTYAVWWIRQAVARAAMDRVVKVPMHVSGTAMQARRIIGKNEDASIGEIAKELGKSEKNIRRALFHANAEIASLQAPAGADGEGRLEDTLCDEDSPDPGGSAEDSDLSRELNAALARLNPREERVLRRRYGLDGRPGGTLDEVGREFGLTRERIRQIEAEALRQLRHPVRGRALAGWYYKNG